MSKKCKPNYHSSTVIHFSSYIPNLVLVLSRPYKLCCSELSFLAWTASHSVFIKKLKNCCHNVSAPVLVYHWSHSFLRGSSQVWQTWKSRATNCLWPNLKLDQAKPNKKKKTLILHIGFIAGTVLNLLIWSQIHKHGKEWELGQIVFSN